MNEKDADAVDKHILASAEMRWLKVARVIFDARERCKEAGLELSNYDIAERLYSLVQTGQLKSAGEIKNWRFSEVRLPSVPN